MADPDTTKLPAEKPRGTGVTTSHERGIVPIEKADPILTVTLAFVFLNIFANRWVSGSVCLLLVAAVIALPFLWKRRQRLPAWARNLLDPVVTRLQACPSEGLLFLGIVLLTVTSWLPNLAPRWRELALALLLVAAYWLSRRGNLLLSGYHRRGLWRLRGLLAGFRETSEFTAPDMREPPPEKEEPDQGTETASMSRQRWEEKQQQRWEDWMQEELSRLNGEYKTKQEPPSSS